MIVLIQAFELLWSESRLTVLALSVLQRVVMNDGSICSSVRFRPRILPTIALVNWVVKSQTVFPEQHLVPSHTVDQLLSRDIFGRLPIPDAAARSGRDCISAFDPRSYTVRTSLLLVAFDLALPANDARYLVRWGWKMC